MGKRKFQATKPKRRLATAEAIRKKTLIFDEAVEERDNFKITFGNLTVLKTIPDMMIEPKWGKKLRMLVLNYLTDKIPKQKERKR